MNVKNLTRFLGQDARVLNSLSGIDRKLPSSWHGVANEIQSQRLDAFKNLVNDVFVDMPETRAILLEKTSDAYIVASGADILLIADRPSDDMIISYRAFAPTGKSMFGGTVGEFYTSLDGFCDFYSMGGLLPERNIHPMGQDGNEFLETPSSELYKTYRSRDFVNVFNSGGKGQGYVSLSSTHADDPEGLLLWVDDDEPMTDMDFWNLFDSWTSIAMED